MVAKGVPPLPDGLPTSERYREFSQQQKEFEELLAATNPQGRPEAKATVAIVSALIKSGELSPALPHKEATIELRERFKIVGLKRQTWFRARQKARVT